MTHPFSCRKTIALSVGFGVSVVGLVFGIICLYSWLLIAPPILYDPAPIFPDARKVDEERDSYSGLVSRTYRVTKDYQSVFEWYDQLFKAENPDLQVHWFESREGCIGTIIWVPYLSLVEKKVNIEICAAKDNPSDTIIDTGTWYK